MEYYIYFEENGKRHSVIRFVKDYSDRRWFRKERISYSISMDEACIFVDEELVKKVCDRIIKDYPDARIYCTPSEEIDERLEFHEFWVICRYDDRNNLKDFYKAESRKSIGWTADMEDVIIICDEDFARQHCQLLRSKTGERISAKSVYLSLNNRLLTPVMMITCTSKSGKRETKFFARLEGKRIRLVNTSAYAKFFTYSEAMHTYEYLKVHNKNFLYAVLPRFDDNVSYRDIEWYMKEKQISRAVRVSFKLKQINHKNDSESKSRESD